MQNESYEKALVEMQSQLPSKDLVLQLLYEAHEAGDARASYAIGTWYLHGEYVELNAKKAVEFLTHAADRDHPEALYDLAVCCEVGTGLSADPRRAFLLYLHAALLGEKQSCYEVGRCYYYGLGVYEDQDVGQVWLDLAKKQGVED